MSFGGYGGGGFGGGYARGYSGGSRRFTSDEAWKQKAKEVILVLGVPLLCVVVLAWMCTSAQTALPTVVPASAPLDQFSEARAMVTAQRLEGVGEHMLHSDNMASTLMQLRTLTRAARRTANTNAVREGRKDFVTMSGDVGLNNLGTYTYRNRGIASYGHIQSYYGYAAPAGTSPETAAPSKNKPIVLVNTHVDTALSSPGSGDAGTLTAVLLEAQRALAYTPGLKHEFVFLVNSGEECGLLGAHAAGQSLMDRVVGVVNYDSAGSGGREMLVRCTSAPLLSAFARAAPRPRGNVFAQDLFSKGYVHGDTDFTVWNEVYHVPALDFAQTHHGYHYHTPGDVLARVPDGSMQHVGENLVALLRAVDSDESVWEADQEAHDNVVFYDVLGWTMFEYSFTLAAVLNMVVIGAGGALLFVRGDPQRFVTASFLSVLGSFIVGVVCAVMAGTVMGTLRPMTWYGSNRAAVLLYALPALFGAGLVQLAVSQMEKEGRHSDKQMESHAASGVLAFWMLMLFVGTLFGYGASYVAMWWVVCTLVGMVLPGVIQSETFSVQDDWKNSSDTVTPIVTRWAVVWMVVYFVPLVLTMDMCGGMLTAFLPMMGRAGRVLNSDRFIATAVGLFTTMIFTAFIPYLRRLRRLKMFLAAVCVLSTLVTLLALAGGAGYSVDAPKRIIVQHRALAYGTGDKPQVRKSFLYVTAVDANDFPLDQYVSDATWDGSVEEISSPTVARPRRRGGWIVPTGLVMMSRHLGEKWGIEPSRSIPSVACPEGVCQGQVRVVWLTWSVEKKEAVLALELLIHKDEPLLFLNREPLPEPDENGHYRMRRYQPAQSASSATRWRMEIAPTPGATKMNIRLVAHLSQPSAESELMCASLPEWTTCTSSVVVYHDYTMTLDYAGSAKTPITLQPL